uniref:Myb_DNA-bind_3 domain-containing protein n=1 Tax=Steinernema glaseri TaxID=37863 RepID=A0A1I7Y496_9BILA
MTSAPVDKRHFFNKAEEDLMWKVVIDAFRDADSSQKTIILPFYSAFWRDMKEKHGSLTRSIGTYTKKFKRMWVRQEVDGLDPETVSFLTSKLGVPEDDVMPVLDQMDTEQPPGLPHHALFGDNPILDAVAERDPDIYATFIETTTKVHKMIEEALLDMAGNANTANPPVSNGAAEPSPKKRKLYLTEEQRLEAARELQLAGKKRKEKKNLKLLVGSSQIANVHTCVEDQGSGGSPKS